MSSGYDEDLIQKLLNSVMIGLLVMVMLALPASLIRVADFGFRAANFAHIIGAIFILLVWFLRR